jgi:hypothetical protein
MLEGIVIAVLSALIVAGILAALKAMREEENRERIGQVFCRHDWRPIDRGGPGIIRITAMDEECHKCGAQRMVEG